MSATLSVDFLMAPKEDWFPIGLPGVLLLLGTLYTGIYAIAAICPTFTSLILIPLFIALIVSLFTNVGAKVTGRSNQRSSEMIGIKLILDSIWGRIQPPRVGVKRKNPSDPSDAPLVIAGDVIGLVFLPPESDHGDFNLVVFRQKLENQIPNVPSSYRFLSKEGWPISESQESLVLLKHIISLQNVVHIQRKFEKPRYGVVTSTGDPIGFVFVDDRATATDVRRAIACELGVEKLGSSFTLLDKNHWPVARHQEDVLLAMDLVNCAVITVDFGGTIKSDSSKDEESDSLETTCEIGSPSKSLGLVDGYVLSDYCAPDKTSEKSGLPASDSADLSITSLSPSHGSKSHKAILISYVRHEAEQHARRLKVHLTDLGCNVFLDVDEIIGGHDWQDTLNNAVRNCEIFVPLITPQYGLTIWTNREIKLADMKNKLILPVNFLDHWPPECLAIQFASTQYINWKSKEQLEDAFNKHGDRAFDIKCWDEPFVQSVAQQIRAIKHAYVPSPTPDVSIAAENTGSTESFVMTRLFAHNGSVSEATASYAVEEICDSLVESEIQTRSIPLMETAFTRASRETQCFDDATDRPLVVITANPEQVDFVELLKTKLKASGCDVWSSTDMCTAATLVLGNGNNSPGSTPATPVYHSMPAFANSTKSTNLTELISLMADVAENQESLPEERFIVPKPKNERPNYLHMMSQTSDICFSQLSELGSQHSVFTPEDLDKAKTFRTQVNKARLVIMILSKAYCQSKTCKSQAFYCDYRKTVIAAKYEDCTVPDWLSRMLESGFLEKPNSDTLACGEADQRLADEITFKVQGAVSTPRELFSLKMSNAKTESLCHHLWKRLQLNDRRRIAVFVAGGSKFFNPKSEDICRAIGQIFAEKESVVLVTSGCFGVAETVGRSFLERSTETKSKPASKKLFHVLPRRDDADLRMKCRQKKDGTCEALPFGETIFVGDSMQERDMVVARVFNFCILVEGGPSSARLAKEFVWNDNIVIPVISTGGAANGKYDSDTSTIERPACVNESDWEFLKRRDVTSEDVALAVVQMVFSLCKSRPKFGFGSQRKNVTQKHGHSKHSWDWRKKGTRFT